MAFTTRIITHTFKNADGTAAAGSVIFTLTDAMTNGTTTIDPGTVTAQLTATGTISQSLTCTSDATTSPSGTMWRVDIRIVNAPVVTVFISLPPGGTVDLGTLMPGTVQKD